MIGKLLKSEGFKVKPELLGAIGSVIGAVNGRNSEKSVLDWLLPNLEDESHEASSSSSPSSSSSQVKNAEEQVVLLLHSRTSVSP
ncbi:unnamed protein product [Microthlaspi erraticum]|uniref:Uncharacterized protein n=1 Tax=Microthlaspi erraticum TaxID=1685480 RepID=A0A6D2HTM1_9BRAS|nr:unnamed protein product [Microthlaspi erraticum]